METEFTKYLLKDKRLMTVEQSTAFDVALRLTNQKECPMCDGTGKRFSYWSSEYEHVPCRACCGDGIIKVEDARA